jgi:hypothetical protein
MCLIGRTTSGLFFRGGVTRPSGVSLPSELEENSEIIRLKRFKRLNELYRPNIPALEGECLDMWVLFDDLRVHVGRCIGHRSNR